MKIYKEIKFLPLIDKIILFFVILFLGSLTNSIFVNQLGYYGALLSMLIKFSIEKKNPFFKTGLEFAILFFVLAEILSTIFSVEPASSFNNLLKRVLLLPIIYSISAVPKSMKQIQIFFVTYLFFAFVSIAIYLYFSADFFFGNLYHIKQSGPSVFQYPITASEIMSFTAIFCFAFFISEKETFRVRGFALLLTGLSLLALLATYKRTGWIGAAAGIIFILILKKKWLYLFPIVVLIVVLSIKDNEWSNVSVLTQNNDVSSELYSFDTDGKAMEVLPSEAGLIVSDYDNGVNVFSGLTHNKRIPTPAPAISSFMVDDSLLCVYLVDTRFLLIDINASSIIEEWTTPGFTHAYKYYDNKLFVLDIDSGLTVYTDIRKPLDFLRYVSFQNYSTFEIDSVKMILFSAQMGLRIVGMEGGLPKDRGVEIPDTKKYVRFFLRDNILYSSDGNHTFSFDIKNDAIELISKTDKISRLTHIAEFGNNLLLVDASANIYALPDSIRSLDNSLLSYNSEKHINSISTGSGEVYLTSYKQSRLKSIWDVNNTSNATRVALWRAGWDMFLEHPFFGVGDIDLANLYRQYKRPFDKEIQGHLHNNYIHILVILGGFGFIATMFLLLKVFLLNLKIFYNVRTIPFSSSYALGTLGGFVSFLFAGLTEWNFGDHEIITMVWLTVGLNIALHRLQKTVD